MLVCFEISAYRSVIQVQFLIEMALHRDIIIIIITKSIPLFERNCGMRANYVEQIGGRKRHQ